MWWSHHRNPKVKGSENFQVAEHICMTAGWCTPTPWGQNLLLCSGPSHILSHVLHLVVHLYLSLYTLFYNKPINIFPWILWAIPVNDQIRRVGHGNLRFAHSQWEAQVTTWTLNWHPRGWEIIMLAKKFIWVFHKMLQKNLNEFLGQLNTIVRYRWVSWRLGAGCISGQGVQRRRCPARAQAASSLAWGWGEMFIGQEVGLCPL